MKLNSKCNIVSDTSVSPILLFAVVNSFIEIVASFSTVESNVVVTRNAALTSIGSKVPIGGVINLFPRYGYLSMSMKVVPESLPWIFLEPSKYIFDPSTIQVGEKYFNLPQGSLPLNNEFQIDLCENIAQLVKAYFRRFVIDGMEYPWKAFAGGWVVSQFSKYFGIDPIYTAGDYRYMLVRVLMVQNSGAVKIFPNVTIINEFYENVETFQPRSYISSYKFFNDIGTHYVSSYLVGNSIYQVFVYDAAGFTAMKRRLNETGGIMSPQFMAQLPMLLSLWVKHMGKVIVLNSSPMAMENVRRALVVPSRFASTPLIFKMQDNPVLVKQVVDYLKNETGGLLGIELKTLQVLFHDALQKSWFGESVKHTMNLWEINFSEINECAEMKCMKKIYNITRRKSLSE